MCQDGSMFRIVSVLLLAAGILKADEISDRKAVEAVIGSLFIPQVRSDVKRMAELTTADFDGDLSAIPVRTIWCETSCAGFKVRSLKFVTGDVVVVDGQTTMGAVPMSAWLMILKRDAPAWRVSSFRLLDSMPVVRMSRFQSN
jgi:hypothetical protein